jgi:hypothetical protein
MSRFPVGKKYREGARELLGALDRRGKGMPPRAPPRPGSSRTVKGGDGKMITIDPPMGAAARPALDGLFATTYAKLRARDGRWSDVFLWVVGEPVPEAYEELARAYAAHPAMEAP